MHLCYFIRLEKELDGDESKDDNDPLRRKDVSKGPIVVITNSSSCEDVHSADEEDSPKTSNSVCQKVSEEQSAESTVEAQVTENYTISDSSSVLTVDESKESDVKVVEDTNSKNSQFKPELMIKPPTAPARTKLVNGSKSTERERAKSESSVSSSSAKKKSYPTPSVPPRMSKHLPAKRTRSDPGSASDQPSRIPRPISNGSRSPNISSTPKSSSKSNRSPKMGIPKKLKFTESPKANRSSTNTSNSVSESLETNTETVTTSKIAKLADNKTAKENFTDYTQTDVRNNETSASQECLQNIPTSLQQNNTDILEMALSDTNMASTSFMEDESNTETICSEILNLFPSDSEFVPSSSSVEERATNPFRQNETNPFKTTESKNPFVKSNNPFEESPDETPTLQPKGQMSMSLNAPPIPER